MAANTIHITKRDKNQCGGVGACVPLRVCVRKEALETIWVNGGEDGGKDGGVGGFLNHRWIIN